MELSWKTCRWKTTIVSPRAFGGECVSTKKLLDSGFGQKILDFVDGIVRDTMLADGAIFSVHQFGGADAFQGSCLSKNFLQTMILIIEILSSSTLQYPYQQWIYLPGLYMRIICPGTDT